MPPRTVFSEKQIVVRKFMDILAAAGIYLHPQSGHRYIKWTFFPDHIWERGVYVRLPREVIFDTPTQTVEERIRVPLKAPWTEEVVHVMREALNEGKVKVLPRPDDRPIVFEVFDRDGLTTDVPRFLRRERSHKRSMDSDSVEQDYDEEDEDEDGSSSEREENGSSHLFEINRYLRQLYRHANIDTLHIKNLWSELPRLMARRKLYMAGLPSACSPYVVDDEISEESYPDKWTPAQSSKFMAAANTGSLKLVRRDSNFLVLYQLVNDDGSATNTLLQFSPFWIQQNMQASIVNNELLFQRQRRNPREAEKPSKIPPNATITSSGRGWIVVEESTDEDEATLAADNPKEQRKRFRAEVSARVIKKIADFNIREDGTEVTWNSLPLALAQSNKYMTGIPPGGLPKIKDDKVVFQASHPSLWSGEVIRRMQENFDNGKVKILPRPPGRIVLFEVEEGGGTYDTTLNFSPEWIALNIDDPSLADKRKQVTARLERIRAPSVSSFSVNKEKEQGTRKFPMSKTQHAVKKTTISERMTKRLEEKAKFLEDSQKGHANVKAVSAMLGITGPVQRPLFRPVTIQKARSSNSSGTSTPYSEPSHPPSNTLSPVGSELASPFVPKMPVAHPRQVLKAKRTSYSNSANSGGIYDHHSRTSSIDDAQVVAAHAVNHTSVINHELGLLESRFMVHSRPEPRWPPAGYPRHSWSEINRTETLSELNSFFARHALGTSLSAWLHLPLLLARRNQYLRGIPFVCLPTVEEDQIADSSDPTRWSTEMMSAMDWAMKSKLVIIKTRSKGRRVLFEIIGPDGVYMDSTLGYSEKWVDSMLPDTSSNLPTLSITNRSPLSPVVSLKRSRVSESSLRDISPTGTERQTKRHRLDTHEDIRTESDTESEVSINRQLIRPFVMSPFSTGVAEVLEEEEIDPKSLPLHRLVPSCLPAPLRDGRVFLRFDPQGPKVEESDSIPGPYEEQDVTETWEWIPPEDRSHGLRPSTIWNPTQAKWRIVSMPRSLEHLGISNGKLQPSPCRVTSNILARGNCYFNESREKWEMDFGAKYKDVQWRIVWNAEFGRWEWIYHFK